MSPPREAALTRAGENRRPCRGWDACSQRNRARALLITARRPTTFPGPKRRPLGTCCGFHGLLSLGSAEAPGLPPTEIEQLVTYPIERAMLGLPNKEEVRSLSKLGLSMVTIVFDDFLPKWNYRAIPEA